jgi:polyhydroxybutyrate depolymerase
VLPLIVSLHVQAGAETVSVTVDGQTRSAVVFAPVAAAAHPPVVFAFHGHFGASSQAARSFRIQDAWPQAVVVYPQGLPTKAALVDPEGKGSGWDVSAEESNRDIRFVDALYKLVMTKYSGDSARVYAMGHSNGSFFMYTLWAIRPNLFAAFGSAEAAGANRFNLAPKPVFITIGSEDRIVPPALQRRSLNAVFQVERSQSSGQPYGEKGTLYEGLSPVVVWNYPGSHAFPQDCVPSMINFFQNAH